MFTSMYQKNGDREANEKNYDPLAPWVSNVHEANLTIEDS